MRNEGLLDALLPKTRQGILAALLGQPAKTWYAAEVARRMGVPSSSLQRELQDLTAAGILKTHRQGRMAYYQANPDSPVFAELRGLLLKTAGLVDVLADVLRPLTPRLELAFVYGSMASGAAHSDSDIDLMVVGAVAPAELALPLRRARELLGRPVNPTIYTPAEFAAKRAAQDAFLTAVMAKPRLVVLDKLDDLDQAPRQ